MARIWSWQDLGKTAGICGDFVSEFCLSEWIMVQTKSRPRNWSAITDELSCVTQTLQCVAICCNALKFVAILCTSAVCVWCYAAMLNIWIQTSNHFLLIDIIQNYLLQCFVCLCSATHKLPPSGHHHFRIGSTNLNHHKHLLSKNMMLPQKFVLPTMQQIKSLTIQPHNAKDTWQVKAYLEQEQTTCSAVVPRFALWKTQTKPQHWQIWHKQDF